MLLSAFLKVFEIQPTRIRASKNQKEKDEVACNLIISLSPTTNSFRSATQAQTAP